MGLAIELRLGLRLTLGLRVRVRVRVRVWVRVWFTVVTGSESDAGRGSHLKPHESGDPHGASAAPGAGEGGQIDVPEGPGRVAVAARTRGPEARLPGRGGPRLYRRAPDRGRDETHGHEWLSRGGVSVQAVVKVPAKEPTDRGESTPDT